MYNHNGNNAAHVAWYSKGVVDYVDDWFLMSTPLPILAIWLVYIAFVLKWGPAYMAKRPSFQLRIPLAIYNLFQVAVSCYIFYLGSHIIYNNGLVSSKCAIEGETSQPIIIHGIYIYLLAKITELLDTVFFVLRKKMNQVTFLHVYHHSLMALSTWFSLKFNPTDALVFLGTINSLVHVVMYGYYGLSAFPSLTKYLWWKKYITSFQLIQFGLITVHVSICACISSCQISYILLFTIFFNLGLMIYLFRDFYIKSYVKKGTANHQSKIHLKENMKHKHGEVASIIQKDSVIVKKIKSKGI